MIPKYAIGVVSKNVVDACIKYCNQSNNRIILLPSRRQVDYNGGYVGWTTETLSSYVKDKTSNILIQRDHGGPKQGSIEDDGLLSFKHDCSYFDMIHIDPWKFAKTFEEGCFYTKYLIEYCYSINNNILFEIGTEESIFKYEYTHLDNLISYINKEVDRKIFERIKYGVIQSGTSLKQNTNTGSYDQQRLVDMIHICEKYNLLSKEHNGDYLPMCLLSEKFRCGLDTVNVAPEFGQIETSIYLKEIRNNYYFNRFFQICLESNRWEKWVDKSFDPFINKENLITICGHYVFNTDVFNNIIKKNIRIDIDSIIINTIVKKLNELHESVPLLISGSRYGS